MTDMKRNLLSCALLLWLLPLTACAFSGKAIEGQVLEAGTNKPIPSAIVVARWQAHLGGWGHGKTVCFHVLTTTTDAQGHYHFPAWKKAAKEDWQKHLSEKEVLISAHKPGYRLAEEYPETTPKLVPFTGAREERLKYLLHSSGLVGCYGAGDEKSLMPVYKAIYDEAKIHATSDKDKDALQTIRRRALYAWSRPPRELTAREIEQAIQSDPFLREQFK